MWQDLDSIDSAQFTLPNNARHSLSNLLIVHPIACAMSLILFVLAACSHLHKPSHSPFYLLCTLLFSLPTFLVALLAFLVDILLFVPHLAFGGWLVLAATVCIAVAGVITCAMRRTVVSREARKRRIAENAEMNGAAYREEQDAIRATYPQQPQQPQATLPSTGLSRTPSREPKIPEFATFNVEGRSPDGERIPLHQDIKNGIHRNLERMIYHIIHRLNDQRTAIRIHHRMIVFMDNHPMEMHMHHNIPVRL